MRPALSDKTVEISALRGIQREDYQVWRHHPVTKLVLQYMADFNVSLQKEAIEKWVNGTLSLPEAHERRARIMILGEMVDLSFEAIEEFYQPETEASATEGY